MSERAQDMFMRRCLHQFHLKTKKLKPSSRARGRWSSEDWARNADYACIVDKLLTKAETLSTTTAEVVSKVMEAFCAGRLHNISGLCTASSMLLVVGSYLRKPILWNIAGASPIKHIVST